MKTLFHYFVIILNIIAVIALLVTYISVYISPAKFWFLGFLGLAYPFTLIVNILFIIYWLFNRWKIAFVSLIVILIGYKHLQNYFQIGKKNTDKEGIIICSYNVKHFNGITKGIDWKENTIRIQNYLRNKNADIICLQELSSPSMNKFNPFITASSQPDPNMNSTNPGEYTGPAIFSRHPIINKGEIAFENKENMIVFADIKIKEDTIRVYSCHLQSYQFTSDDINSIDALSIENHRNMKRLRVVGHKMKQAFIKRPKHANKLNESIRQSPFPVIVCGDFNDPPISYTYRTVRGDLKDAFVESGAGIGNSYIGRVPSLRIDYILYSPLFTGYNFTVDKKADYSDHYPLSCKLIKTSE
ncbi:MAG: endonuclease/exonuclease/phosphatase family protein [Mangrovibacterium sp.]